MSKEPVVKKLILSRDTLRKLNDTKPQQDSQKGVGTRTTRCCPCTGTSTIGPTQPLIC